MIIFGVLGMFAALSVQLIGAHILQVNDVVINVVYLQLVKKTDLVPFSRKNHDFQA